jgi:glycosyltransferase involved in cell wall biosynthesis
MKIGIVLHGFTQGGIERVVCRLLPQFTSKGCEVVIFSEYDREKDVYHNIPEHRRVVVGHGENRATRLAAALKTENVDICLVEDHWILWTARDCAVIRNMGVPYIVHIHNVFSEFFLMPEIWRDKKEWYDAFIKANALITLSRYDEYFFRLIGCNARYFLNPVEDVPNGFKRCEKRHELLWLARFEEAKRPLDAIEIFRRVLERIPDAKLVMVGGLGSLYGRQISKMVAADPKLSASVKLPGFSANVWAWYSRASVFLSTSSLEGFPLTFMEAGAAGVPIVGYDLPYIETVKGNDGFIPVKQGDVNAAADAICRLLEDDEAREKAGAANRATFERVKSFDQMVAYDKLFDDVKAGVRVGSPSGDETAQVCLKTLAEHAMFGIAGLKDIIRRDAAKIKNLKRSKRRKNRIIAALALVVILLSAVKIISGMAY